MGLIKNLLLFSFVFSFGVWAQSDSSNIEKLRKEAKDIRSKKIFKLKKACEEDNENIVKKVKKDFNNEELESSETDHFVKGRSDKFDKLKKDCSDGSEYIEEKFKKSKEGKEYANLQNEINQIDTETSSADNSNIAEDDAVKNIIEITAEGELKDGVTFSVSERDFKDAFKNGEASYLAGYGSSRMPKSFNKPRKCNIDELYDESDKDIFKDPKTPFSELLSEKGKRLAYGRMAEIKLEEKSTNSDVEVEEDEPRVRRCMDYTKGSDLFRKCENIQSDLSLLTDISGYIQEYTNKKTTSSDNNQSFSVDLNKRSKEKVLGITFNSQNMCKQHLYEKFKECMGFKNKVSITETKGDTRIHIPTYEDEDFRDEFNDNNLLIAKATIDQLQHNNGTIEKIPGEPSELKTLFNKLKVGSGESSVDTKKYTKRYSTAFVDQYKACISFRKLVFNTEKKYEDDKDNGKTLEIISFDGKYKCVKSSAWTQDFYSCKDSVVAYNTFAVADRGVELGVKAHVFDKTMRIQREQSASLGQGDDPLKASLRAQSRTLQKQEDAELIKMSAHAARAATLSGFLAAYTTPASFSSKCSDEKEDDDIYINKNFFCVTHGLWKQSMENDPSTKIDLFENQDVRRRMWQEVGNAAMAGAMAGLYANQYHKMQGDIQKYEEKFNDLEDLSGEERVAVELEYCKFNPSSPKCRKRGARVINGGDGFSYGNIENQNGSQAFNVVANDNPLGDFDDEPDSEFKQNTVDDLSDIVDKDSTDRFSNDFNAPGAGGSTKGSALGSAGGGGGAPGGGGGGGGAPSAGRRKPASQKYGVSSYKAKYGKGGGSPTYAKGKSARRKKSSKNAFSKMFNNKRTRTVANTNDIAPAHSGLFDKISKRYKTLATDNRILNLTKK